jgi:hypothetical protein
MNSRDEEKKSVRLLPKPQGPVFQREKRKEIEMAGSLEVEQ